jgi:hypothetical protein
MANEHNRRRFNYFREAADIGLAGARAPKTLANQDGSDRNDTVSAAQINS